MVLQLDGKLMEKIAITTQSLRMLNIEKSQDPKLKIPREVLALSYCIIHMTCFSSGMVWFSSGMVFMLTVCSQSCSATLLWAFHFMKLFNAFHYSSFSTFIFFYRQKQCICDIHPEHVIKEHGCTIKPGLSYKQL